MICTVIDNVSFSIPALHREESERTDRSLLLSLRIGELPVNKQEVCTCVSSTNVVLHVVLFHADVVTDAAAE